MAAYTREASLYLFEGIGDSASRERVNQWRWGQADSCRRIGGKRLLRGSYICRLRWLAISTDQGNAKEGWNTVGVCVDG
jgi:hypothetical protein